MSRSLWMSDSMLLHTSKSINSRLTLTLGPKTSATTYSSAVRGSRPRARSCACCAAVFLRDHWKTHTFRSCSGKSLWLWKRMARPMVWSNAVWFQGGSMTWIWRTPFVLMPTDPALEIKKTSYEVGSKSFWRIRSTSSFFVDPVRYKIRLVERPVDCYKFVRTDFMRSTPLSRNSD